MYTLQTINDAVVTALEKDTLIYIGLLLGTLTAIVTAIAKLIKYVKKLIVKVSEWFKFQIRSIIQEEIQPIHDNIQILHNLQTEIQVTVSEFLPNGGSHFRDLVTELNDNIKEMKGKNGK